MRIQLPGVWTVVPEPDGGVRLDEFGEEGRVHVRAWSARVGWPALRERAAAQRATTTAAWEPERVDVVDDRPVAWTVGRVDGETTFFHALIDGGDVVVGLSSLDRSGRTLEEAAALGLEMARGVDVGGLADRVRAATSAGEAQPADVVPWVVLPSSDQDVPGVELANGLVLAVATLGEGFARVLGPTDALWRRSSGPTLLALARMNLVRRMLGGQVPTEVRTSSEVLWFVAGPHPLAWSLVALPDLGPWAAEHVDGELSAFFPHRDQLVVARSDLPPETFGDVLAAPMPLVRWPT